MEIVNRRVVGIDGHDGAGKTTLSKLVASKLGGRYVRPFAGQAGIDLMAAYKEQNFARVLQVGDSALRAAMDAADETNLVVLDRSWMTVSSLVPRQLFAKEWANWIPSVLCWCDLQTTISRLNERADDPTEMEAYHANFLGVYLDCIEVHPSPVLRTDQDTVENTLVALQAIVHRLLESQPQSRPRAP